MSIDISKASVRFLMSLIQYFSTNSLAFDITTELISGIYNTKEHLIMYPLYDYFINLKNFNIKRLEF